MTVQRYDWPKQVLADVRVDGEWIILRFEPDEWRSDPYFRLKDRLSDTSFSLFTRENGGDIWIRPSTISAFVLEDV